MFRRILKRRPSGAMMVAIVALVAALAGTAVAGGGFVTKKKFNKKITALNTSVSTKVGGPLNYVSVTANIPVNNQAGSAGTDVAAACPPGSAPTGGGIKLSNDVVEFVNDSHPTAAGWAGTVFNAGTVTHQATVTAICAIASTTGSRPAS
jgi:hypothetical protein